MRWLILAALPFLLVGQTRPPRPRIPSASGSTGAYNLPAATFHGILKEIAGNDIVLVSEDNQEVTIHRTRKTKFLRDGNPAKASDLHPGALLTVDVTKAPDLSLLAVNVMIEKKPESKAESAPPADAAEASDAGKV